MVCAWVVCLSWSISKETCEEGRKTWILVCHLNRGANWLGECSEASLGSFSWVQLKFPRNRRMWQGVCFWIDCKTGWFFFSQHEFADSNFTHPVLRLQKTFFMQLRVCMVSVIVLRQTCLVAWIGRCSGQIISSTLRATFGDLFKQGSCFWNTI